MLIKKSTQYRKSNVCAREKYNEHFLKVTAIDALIDEMAMRTEINSDIEI